MNSINIFGALGSIIDDLFLGVLVINNEGHIIYYNKCMGNLDELTPEEALGYKISEVYSVREEQSPTMRTLLTQQPVYGEFMLYKTARGRQISSLNYTYPLYHLGELIGAICFSMDISSLSKLATIPLDKVKKQNLISDKNSKTVKFDDIIGINPVFREALDIAKLAACGPSPVMLIGETGTGKDLFAQAIHNYSERSKKIFLAINCSAIPEALLEGVLFGTTKGAFTGAVEKEGLLEYACGGTVFLDEINSMPLMLQAKLLRVLQDQKVRRVGGLSEKKINIRIISAANVNPLIALSENTLRADLYYRIGVIQVQIPPLRERQEDISYLAKHFIKTISERLKKNIKGISLTALNSLNRRPWPGNVRELEHVIESALNLVESGEELTERHLKRVLRHVPKSLPSAPHHLDLSGTYNYHTKVGSIRSDVTQYEHNKFTNQLSSGIRHMEYEHLVSALKRHSGNISRAARSLGISPQLMSYKMKKHGLKRDLFITPI